MSAKLAKRLVTPDHCTHPVWVQTYGPEVCEVNAVAGFAPDPQQEHILDAIFGILPDGRPAEFAHAIESCRQNLKTGTLKMATNGWLIVTEQPLIVWSAHELDTTLEAHRDLAQMWEDTPFLSKRLKPGRSRDGIKANNNEASIETAAGPRVKFKARTRTGARGLSGDKLILDEALFLLAAMMGAILPVMTARPHGQVVYAGSAGLSGSDVWRDIVQRGEAGTSPRLGFDCWRAPREDCADPNCVHPKDALVRGIDCALDREHLIRAANPTITTGRITVQTIRDLRQELPPAEYMRECFGWWDEVDATLPPAIDLVTWIGRQNNEARQPTQANLVVDVRPDRSAASIGVGAQGAHGKTLVMTRTRPGTSWVVDELAQLIEHHDIAEVALHPRTQAGGLIPALTKAGIEFEPLTTGEVGNACAWVQEAIKNDEIEHVGQADLDSAVGNAATKKSGDLELFVPINPDINIGPLVAASVAGYRWARGDGASDDDEGFVW